MRERLPWPWYWRLKRIREEWLAFFAPDTLTGLARVYKTDKWGKHYYTDIYEQWLRPMRYKSIRLLEIGVGGVTKPDRGGNSLRMWKRFFPKGIITGIDLYDKQRLAELRMHIYQGDQSDENFLHEVNRKEGPFDVIIDDGSHMQSHVVKSLEVLYPLLKSGGIYIIEDTQTAYWPKFEGSTSEMRSVRSIMNYMIDRIHDVNANEWMKEDLPGEAIARLQASSIAFYHNLIIIVKS